MSVRRIVAVGLSIVGAGALAMAYLQHQRTGQPEPTPKADSPAVRFEVIDRRAIPVDGVERAIDIPRRLLSDPPRVKLPENEPAGRRLHVSPRGDDAAEGSPERPWRSLDRALCRLEPGDRLTVGPGSYIGPFEIASDCRDGTVEHPIEVYASDDATLVGAGRGGPEPVLTIARRYWVLAGLEVSAGPTNGPAIRVAGARNVALNALHLVGTPGDGIWVEPGSEEIDIHDCHLHQLGAGGPRASTRRAGAHDGDDAAERVVAVRILPGTRAIRVTGSRIHNIWGEPIRVVTPDEHVAAGGERLAAAADLEIDTRQFQNGQVEW